MANSFQGEETMKAKVLRGRELGTFEKQKKGQ